MSYDRGPDIADTAGVVGDDHELHRECRCDLHGDAQPSGVSSGLDSPGLDGRCQSGGAVGPTRHRIVVPSPDVWAVVRTGPLPVRPPDDLLPFVTRRDDDWVLSDDALAFGRVDTVDQFWAWRSSWEQAWTLDPVANMHRLVTAVAELEADGEGLSTALADALSGFWSDCSTIEVHRRSAGQLAAAFRRAGDLIRERGALGYGIIDRTPKSERVGLARSWPASGGPEVVAASEGLRVVFEPSTGLSLIDRAGLPTGHERERFGPIEHAEHTSHGWIVASGADVMTVGGRRARALAWLVPGATAWAVRRVPEVVVWARTLAGIAEGADLALRSSEMLRLTTRRPIADDLHVV